MFLKTFKLHLKLALGMLFFLGKESSTLRAMKIRVPEVTKSGDTVTLSCEYDLEQVPLYSLKWYFNDEEFYRFVPKESPPFKAFAMKHVNVDISRSGPTEVTLRGVRRELTGDYKCEVSADAPLFHTDIKGAHMVVADLPSSNPVMNIQPAKVEIGKKIAAHCYSPGSNPPANLTWFINEEEVSEDNESIKVYPTEIELDQALGLQSSKSRIEVTTNKSHFILGNMNIKCAASIYSIWKEAVEKVIRDDTPQLAPVLGSTSSQGHTDQVIEIVSSSSRGGMLHHVVYYILNMYCILMLFLR